MKLRIISEFRVAEGAKKIVDMIRKRRINYFEHIYGLVVGGPK